MKELIGKTAIVTGATSGMGKAIAQKFAAEGANVICSGRREKAGQALVESITRNNGEALFYAGDVSNPETNQKLVELALEKFGCLDILCTNAGDLGLGAVTELSTATWQKTLDVNLSSVFYLFKYGLPELQKSNGVAVINSSIAAFKSFPNHPAYCASKAGLVALAKQVAVDYSPVVRVNVICPGPVDTPLIWDSAKAFPVPEEAVQNAAQNTLLKRLGLPEDIAQLALFLASAKSSWITGTVINIDGGVLAGK